MSVIVILGAGVAGLSAAIALRRSGHEVEVRERAEVPGGEVDSAGLVHVNPAGQRDFDVLGVGGVRDAGHAISAIALRDRDGVEVTRFPARGGDYRYVARSELIALLLEEARRSGARIETGWEAVHVELRDHGVLLTSSHGDHVTADLLIGADGPGSAVRAVVDAEGAARPAGHWFVHGTARRAEVPPTEHRIVEMTRDDRTGHAFGRTSTGHDVDAWWMRIAGDRPREPLGRLDDTAREQLVSLAPPGAPARELVEATDGSVATYGAWTMTNGARWYAGRAVLVGDAAHACSPAASWSAALAAEDAVALDAVLRSRGPDDALPLFELQRRARAERAIAAGNPRAGIAAGPAYELAAGAEVTRASAAAVDAAHRLDER